MLPNILPFNLVMNCRLSFICIGCRNLHSCLQGKAHLPCRQRRYMHLITSMAVFCGSRSGNDPLFAQHAAELGTLLAAHKIKLVYGGGRKGLMGTVADAVMKGSGQVVGVIPQILLEWEQQHEGITELRVVPDMHTRKKLLYELCDAAVILPGGFGTLDELFEMLTWNNLQIHNKSIFILNSNGYYNHLAAHIHHMEQQGFLYESMDRRMTICATPAEVLTAAGF